MNVRTKLQVMGWLFTDRDRIERIWTNWLNETAMAVKVDFGVTVQTWNHKPDFTIESAPHARSIGTDWNTGAGRIYGFVALGTRVRYATMSKPFAPKTVPGIIGSYSGVGHAQFISKKHPRPGIKARRFVELIATKWRTLGLQNLQRAIDAEIRK